MANENSSTGEEPQDGAEARLVRMFQALPEEGQQKVLAVIEDVTGQFRGKPPQPGQ